MFKKLLFSIKQTRNALFRYFQYIYNRKSVFPKAWVIINWWTNEYRFFKYSWAEWNKTETFMRLIGKLESFSNLPGSTLKHSVLWNKLSLSFYLRHIWLYIIIVILYIVYIVSVTSNHLHKQNFANIKKWWLRQ